MEDKARVGVPFTSETARAASLASAAKRRETVKALAAALERERGQGSPSETLDTPILTLAMSKARAALNASEDPRTIASLIAGISRLIPQPKTADVPEDRDELVSRYRRAGYELPYT